MQSSESYRSKGFFEDAKVLSYKGLEVQSAESYRSKVFFEDTKVLRDKVLKVIGAEVLF